MVISSRMKKSNSGSHGGLASKNGRPRPGREREDERLRELIIANSYRLLYKIISDDEVHIIVFINSARDLNAFLDRQGRV